MFSKTIKLIIVIALLGCFTTVQATDITDNTCTFKVEGKLFTLAYLNMNKPSEKGYYTSSYNSNTITFNFCDTFVPTGCTNQNKSAAYSYVIQT